MRLKTVNSRQGLAWTRAGLGNFVRQPLGYTAIFSTVALAGLLLSQLGWIGTFAALTLTPFATMGFMVAGREQHAGRTVHPGHLIEPWQQAPVRVELLKLGALYATLVVICFMLASWVSADGAGRLAQQALQQSGAASPPLEPGPNALSAALPGLLIAVALFGSLSLVFWHAPALVAWDRQPVLKALFGSAVACWRNLGAFALMGLAWIGLMLAFSGVALMFFTAIGQPGGAALAALPGALLFSTAFQASLYRVWDDCFEPAAAATMTAG